MHKTSAHGRLGLALVVAVATIAAVIGAAERDASAQDMGLLGGPFSPDRIHLLFSAELTTHIFGSNADHRASSNANLDFQPGIAGTIGIIFPENALWAHGDTLSVGWHPGNFVDVEFRSLLWFLTHPAFTVHPKVFLTARFYDMSENTLFGMGLGGGLGVDVQLTPFMMVGVEVQALYMFFDAPLLEGAVLEFRFPVTFVL